MTLPDMMHAAYMPELDSLAYDLLPTPQPQADEVLVKVHAIAVNLEDVMYKTGRYFISNPLPHVLGSEGAGEIVALGAEVSNYAVGDRVVFRHEELGSERNGTYAEYVTVPTAYLHPIPDAIDYQMAVSVNFSLIRAWVGMTYNAKIRKRETVVINGAATALGLAAIEIAKSKEATIIAIANPAKTEQLRAIGVNMVFDEESVDLVSLVMTVTEDKGASLVVDLLGAASLQQSIEMMAYDGRVLSLSTYAGEFVEINLQDLVAMNGTLYTAGTELKKGDLEKLWDMLTEEKFAPVIDSVLPLSQAQSALERIETDQAFGTILLIPDALQS